MLTSIALILLGIYVSMPQAVATTLIVFGGLGCFGSLCSFVFRNSNKEK